MVVMDTSVRAQLRRWASHVRVPLGRRSPRMIGRAALVMSAVLLGACGEDSCFAGPTRIATPRGPRAIRDLAVGDEVWSFDPIERRFAVGRVAAIHRARGEVHTLRTARGELRAVTASHPIFSRGELVRAADLALRAPLLHWDGDPASWPQESELLSKSPATPGDEVEVFNLTVEGAFSTFFADGIFVHNKSVPPSCTEIAERMLVRAPSKMCVGETARIDVTDLFIASCPTDASLADRAVLATTNPAVVVVDGTTLIAVGPGGATIRALVDGASLGETSVLVRTCEADAGTDAASDAPTD